MRSIKLKIFGVGKPVKLIVGGLHGREWRTTRRLINNLSLSEVYGTLVVIPRISFNSKYVSTLKREYYETDAGKKLLNILRLFNPLIYVEVHAYSKKSYYKLTDPYRLEKIGVPPFFKLPNGYLLFGSVSHHLLSIYPIRIALALELPMKKDINAELLLAKKILDTVSEAKNEDEFWLKIKEIYGENREFAEYIDRIRLWLKKYN